MITNKDLSTISLSPTNKDFVQIWNELLDIAGKLSARWDPTSTNESDPGIVLLKALAGIADKLNYNIDKNILEAYMPTAAQKESMYKLCDMMGYNIKYYRSAETYATIWYTGDWDTLKSDRILIPPFTVLSDTEGTIHYVTTNEIDEVLTPQQTSRQISCIEGTKVDCTSINVDNVITMDQLTSDYRFYLPELQIAENGVFIQNYDIDNKTVQSGARWESVSNLNTYPHGKTIFKFCFDSLLGRPYIQFPTDIATLIQDGLKISYIRTSGINGNIAIRTLSKITSKVFSGTGESVDADTFVVLNENTATTGSEIETISEAYLNFKKTVGTFETLVTCRDYMNAIYNMTESDYTVEQHYATPLVSNINVTDIRNDINRAITICSMDEFGIKYLEKPLKTANDAEITHFDLVLYPFKTYYQQTSGTSSDLLASNYKKSFQLDLTNNTTLDIDTQLKSFKTISHNLTYPKDGELISIRNYLKLDALIATSVKVKAAEEEDIIKNIKLALANEFNMRNIDFGEEIPFESILRVIENADTRIKVVALQEPEVLTKFVVKDGDAEKEYDLASACKEGTIKDIKKVYNKLVLRNVLAGRVPLFNYSTDFIADFGEAPLIVFGDKESEEPTGIDEEDIISGKLTRRTDSENAVYYGITNDGSTSWYKQTEPEVSLYSEITAIEGRYKLIPEDSSEYLNIPVQDNEVIKFRAPNLVTTTTYPAYVNYRFDRVSAGLGSDGTSTPGIYAKSQSLEGFMGHQAPPSTVDWTRWEALFNSINEEDLHSFIWGEVGAEGSSDDAVITALDNNGISASTWSSIQVIKQQTSTGVVSYNYFSAFNKLIEHLYTLEEETKVSYYPLNTNTINKWNNFIKKQLEYPYPLAYLSQSATYAPGKFIDEASSQKFIFVSSVNFNKIKNEPFKAYVITNPGQDPIPYAIPADTDYQLQSDEILYINYTTSEKEEDGSQGKGQVVTKTYGPGTIIRPNFELNPGSFNIAYNKLAVVKNNVEFTNPINGTRETPELFSLSADQQIEIRELMQIVPGKADQLQPGAQTTIRVYYNFTWPKDAKEYELKTGEYFFISDKQGLSSAYYGSGSVISLVGTFSLVSFTESDLDINIVSALTDGLHILPWKTQTISKANHFKITEYQYHTLTAGNVLESAIIDQDKLKDKELDSSIEWIPVTDIRYKNSSTEATYSTLPGRAITNIDDSLVNFGWEMRSFLTINTLEGNGQILNITTEDTQDSIKIKAEDILKIYSRDKDNPDGIKTDEIKSTVGSKTAFKTSYPLYVVSDIYQVPSKQEDIKIHLYESQQVGGTVFAEALIDENGVPKVAPQVFNKLIDKDPSLGQYLTADSIALSSEIFNNTWIKSSGSDLIYINKEGIELSKPLVLPIYIPEDSYGIFSLFIKLPSLSTNPDKISIASDTAGSISLINGGPATSISLIDATKQLSKLSCIKITKSCTLYLYLNSLDKDISPSNIVILWDAIRYVKKEAEIYPGLQYQEVDEGSITGQILKDISAFTTQAETDFYYTVPIENTLALEASRNNIIDMSAAEIFYDVNNVNNHFTITTIDIDHIDTGIKIAKSSKY